MNYCKAWARPYDQGELSLNFMHALVSSICMFVEIEAQAISSCIILTWPHAILAQTQIAMQLDHLPISHEFHI